MHTDQEICLPQIHVCSHTATLSYLRSTENGRWSSLMTVLVLTSIHLMFGCNHRITEPPESNKHITDGVQTIAALFTFEKIWDFSQSQLDIIFQTFQTLAAENALNSSGCHFLHCNILNVRTWEKLVGVCWALHGLCLFSCQRRVHATRVIFCKCWRAMSFACLCGIKIFNEDMH